MNKLILVLLCLLLVGCENKNNNYNLQSEHEKSEMQNKIYEEEIDALRNNALKAEVKLEEFSKQVIEYNQLKKDFNELVDELTSMSLLLEESIDENENSLDRINELEMLETENMKSFIRSIHNDVYEYVYVPDDNAYKSLVIIDESQETTNIDFDNIVTIGGSGSFLAVYILGTIENLKLERYDPQTDSYMVIEDLGQQEDCIIHVYSSFPDGVPYERLAWIDSEGKETYYDIGVISYTGDGYYRYGGDIIFN